MKRFLTILFAGLMLVSALAISAFASDSVAFLSYNDGKDTNDGLTEATPKRSIGAADGDGVLGLVKDGGTVVVTKKMYFGGNYTWNANGPVTITSNYGGVNYINKSPLTNPTSGVIKVKIGCKLTVASDLTLDDIILFSESTADTITVKEGGVLTIGESLLSMSKSTHHFNIVVEKGGKAVLNGGIFSSVTGEGEIIIGDKCVISSEGAYSSVAYMSYLEGKNTNAGTSAEAPKKTFGTTDGDGVASLLSRGGVLVVSGKAYIGSTYTWNVIGKSVFTANYHGVDYRNPLPKSDPESGVFKIKGGITMTIGSDVEFKDIIIFNENGEATFIVSPGAILTVDESVTTVATREKYMNIIVSAGAKAIINGGTFASVGGEGTVVIGPKATVLSRDVKVNEAEKPEHVVKTVYLDGKNGDNAGDGKTPETAVRGYAAGAFKHITVGGTIVICGDSTIGGSGANNEYVLPSLAKTLTLTSVGGGVSYKETATLKFKENTLFTIGNDVVFDNIVLTEEKGQTTISVKNGAAVTFTDSAEFVSKKEDGSHYKLVLEKGTFAILSAKAKEALTVTGEGTVIDYVDGFSEVIGKYAGETKVVELTIGSPVAYVNGIANTLDAAPINRNSRTMLPVRFLANSFGVSNDGISWDDATKTATLKNDSVTVVVTIGAPSMTVNGSTVALDSPAVIENSRTYLPVRAIATALGVLDSNISWNDATKTATLVK